MPDAVNLYYTHSQKTKQPNPLVVLLIHGAGSNHLVWPASLRRLDGFLVIAPDLPGHGRSLGAPEQSIERYAKKVIRFLDESGIYQIFLVGHSMGGAIGLQICKSFQERLVGLAMISSGATIDVPRRFIDLLSNPNYYQDALNYLQPLLFSPKTSTTLKQQIMASMQKTRSGILYSDWLACANFDLRGELNQIRRPVWIASGRDDKITTPAVTRQLVTQIRRSRHTLFEDAGHMLILEKPQEIITWLVSILNQIPNL